MAASAEEGFECSHCGDSVPATDAVMLTPKGDKSLWRYLCPECLESMGVPQGYVVDRDISFLRGGGSVSTGADADAKPSRRKTSDVIADFPGKVITQEMPTDELRDGRIVMNRQQLVLATLDLKTTIRLNAIHDADIRRMDEDASEYFNDVIALKYRHEGDKRMAFIAGTADVISQFSTILYKALLSGTSVDLNYPATEGGYVQEETVRTGILRVDAGRIDITNLDSPVSIDLDRVLRVGKRDRAWPDGGLPVLAIAMERDRDTVHECELHLDSARRMSLLARYVRLQYGDRLREINGLELTDIEQRTLTSLFSAGPAADLESILDQDADQIDTTIDSLVEKGLLVMEDEGRSLTRAGKVLVFRDQD